MPVKDGSAAERRPNQFANAGLIPLQASTSVFTDATDLSNITFSVVVELDLDDLLDPVGADDDGHADSRCLS